MKTANTITKQDVSDILSAAFEGGITYWAQKATASGEWPDGAEFASDVPAAGGIVRIHYDLPEHDEGNGAGRFLMTLAAIKRGIRMAAAHKATTPTHFIENHDAGDADIAVQFAIFGEVIYG